MEGNWKNVSPSHPCPICTVLRGHPETDWCSYLDDIDEKGREKHLVWCPRSQSSPGQTFRGADGVLYRMWKATAQGELWEPLEQWERYQPKDGSSRRCSSAPVTGKTMAKPVTETKYEGVSDILGPEMLDKFYRSMLSNLVLEDRDRSILMAEWGDRTDAILSAWPIKSLAPVDVVRFSSEERYFNISRKKLSEKIVEECGEPAGVPGFYKAKNGLWTTYKLSGIVYPIFNSKGQVIRVRIGDRHPAVEGSLDGADGIFSYRKTEKGTGWTFAPGGDYRKAELVWVYGASDNRITLNKKGLPDVKGAKVRGKYKNFSSYDRDGDASSIKDGVETIVNRYPGGCQSGSYCSVYRKTGDDNRVVYVTEGEKKAIVANNILNVPTISVPGVSTFGKLFECQDGLDCSIADDLISKGMKLAVIAYDSDKSHNDQVLKNEFNAVKSFMEKGIKIGIGSWNPRWGKGLDDILLKGVMPEVTIVQ